MISWWMEGIGSLSIFLRKENANCNPPVSGSTGWLTIRIITRLLWMCNTCTVREKCLETHTDDEDGAFLIPRLNVFHPCTLAQPGVLQSFQTFQAKRTLDLQLEVLNPIVSCSS